MAVEVTSLVWQLLEATAYKAYKISHLVGLKKTSPIICVLCEKRRLKNSIILTAMIRTDLIGHFERSDKTVLFYLNLKRDSYTSNMPGTAQIGAISKAHKEQNDFKVSRKSYIRTLKTSYPNFEKVIFRKSRTVPKKIKRGAQMRNVISGISFIRFAVNRVCAKKNPKWDPFLTLKNSPKNVIYGIRYFRNSLYPVCAKSGMGSVIVQGDSL